MNNPTTAHDILVDLEGRLDKCTHKGDTLKAQVSSLMRINLRPWTSR